MIAKGSYLHLHQVYVKESVLAVFSLPFQAFVIGPVINHVRPAQSAPPSEHQRGGGNAEVREQQEGHLRAEGMC